MLAARSAYLIMEYLSRYRHLRFAVNIKLRSDHNFLDEFRSGVWSHMTFCGSGSGSGSGQNGVAPRGSGSGCLIFSIRSKYLYLFCFGFGRAFAWPGRELLAHDGLRMNSLMLKGYNAGIDAGLLQGVP